jgi:subtilisin family serine protease
MRLPRRSIVVGVAALTMTALTAAPAVATEPTGTVLSAGGATAVPDSYIVVLKDSVIARTEVGTVARELTARHGGAVARTYRSALRGFEITADATAAARIAAHPAVAYVEQNHTVRLLDTQTNPPSWGLDRIDQPNLPLDNSYTYPSTAANVSAYIIDTGVHLSHSDFGGRAVTGYDAITSGGTAADCNGHGTHVAGTVAGSAYGVAKAARIYAVRVLNCSGSGTNAGVIAGVDWVTANAVKPAVANMSLGGGANVALDNAVNNSINSGITYSLAAGNDSGGNACNVSPARVPAGITVGATTSSDARATYSNIGTCLDIFAPGSSITSAWHTSNTATNTISGTSMAAPHVAGAAALVLAANPTFSPQQVRDHLVAAATDGVITNPGNGSVNKLLHVVNDDTPPPADDFSVTVSPANGTVEAGEVVTTTVATAVTNGVAQPVALTATGLPAGATAVFDPATVTAGGSATLTVSTAENTPGGTYRITVTGTGASATRSATYTLTVTGSGGGSCTGTNGTRVDIPDPGTATSTITIVGCGRNASTTATVAVNIVHTYRGDLVINLIAPDGTSYRLKDWALLDGRPNVIETYPVNLSAEAADGAWRLQVRDIFSGDTGYIATWTLTL